jgi:hypothetical protein
LNIANQILGLGRSYFISTNGCNGTGQ